ncbi:MAG TPA: DUF5348 domain-containing protein [Anaerolineaceae bacterium]|jgi:hypothetical protein
MSMILNETEHWQLPDGGELHSGEFVEVLAENGWIPGRIEYRPRRHYVLVLDDGQEWAITADLVVRSRDRKWAR